MTGSRRARSSGAREGRSKGPRGTAKDRALRLLGVRWRSRRELELRLRQAGFEPEDIEQALADLEAVGLIDDERFALEVVRDRAGRALAGDRAIAQELRRRGVSREDAEGALAGAGGEEARALELASRQAARLRTVPADVAYRRLLGHLQRRGYGPSVAVAAARSALADRAEMDAATPSEP